jgi:2,4-dienoyl-CoA reductase-like NADH-dependent reductase (Old Yellow Enzyme family)
MMRLFEEVTVNGMTLANRLVRSATWEGMCDNDGRPGPALTECYVALASGGVGLIVTGFAFVRAEGKQLPFKLGIHTDEFAGEMRSLTDGVHEAGGKLCLQLVHAGGQTDSSNAGRQPLAPSAVKIDQYPELPAEMTEEDIARIISAFGDGARRA